jgi:hypothetical protein
VGVTITKKTIVMTIGETNLPNKTPNLNQSLFRGVNNFELINPRIKKIKEIANDQILIFASFNNGSIETIKKNAKKTIPKLLFDEISILLSFIRCDVVFLI